MMRHTDRRNQKGFTIVELMIATSIFGVVLLVITTAILQITRIYYKGITDTKVQNVARSVSDTIAQGIQFNGGNVTVTPVSPTAGLSYAFCVGSKQYSYTLGYQMSEAPSASQTNHALVVDDLAGCSSGSTAQNVRNASVSGRELLEPGMRLSNLKVSLVTANVYKVTVRIVNGEDDLLNNPNSTTASCKGFRLGSQFCAISELTTTVVKRVE